MPPPLETSPFQLRVEGLDDHHSVIHLLRRHGYDWDDIQATRPYVSYSEGKDKLLDSLPVAVKGPYKRLGFVLDADTVLLDRWAGVRDRLRGQGVDAPNAPDPSGTIMNGLVPGSLVGVWLMPDNISPGRLEDFLTKLVPEGDQCWAYAKSATAEAARHGCNVMDTAKSVLHAWLAWRDDPGLPFGSALRARVFRHDSEDARKFVAWFRRLFG